MGIYGVIQYLYAPVWDRFWMDNVSERIASFGTPEPMGIRVFSTMNGPQPFALVMVAGLLITFYGRSSLLQKSAWIAGYAGLLLSMARSAWLEWAIALLALAVLGRSQKILSALLGTTLLLVVVGTVIAKSSAGQSLIERFQTLNNVAQDDSGQERLAGYESVLRSSSTSPFGDGWRIETEGNDAMPIHDSTAAEVVLSTGWFGFVMFYSAITAAIIIMFRDARASQNNLAAIICSLLLALLVETTLNSLLGGPTEMALWTCIGIGLAESKYEEQTNCA
jgi:hypothetical protein